DMESALILRAAAEAGCPSLVLRGVSDDATESLSPALAALVIEDGRVRKVRAATTMLRHPAILRQALKLRPATRAALAAGAAAPRWPADDGAALEPGSR